MTKYLYFKNSVEASIFNKSLAEIRGCDMTQANGVYNKVGLYLEIDDGGKYLPADIIKNLSDSQPIEYQSKLNRESATNADIECFGVMWQIDKEARDNIGDAFKLADINNIPDSYCIDWRLADNTWRSTTLADIKQLFSAYTERKQAIWTAFEVWAMHDMSEVFEYAE